MRPVRRALWIAAKVRTVLAPLALIPSLLAAGLASGLAAALAAGACEPPRQAAAPPREEEAPKLVGVSPSEFRCESLITAETMTQLLGAPARLVEGAASSPAGVAAPCNFLVAAAAQEAWTFDIDCRDGMKKRADALFEQYERTSAELVALAAAEPASGNAASDGGARPRRKPELAREVVVGSRGLDHHGQGLLFIDDDAPCYVRVLGPDAEHRLALAKHLAAALTPSTAPMSPRPALR
jgi:hypothetical protein